MKRMPQSVVAYQGLVKKLANDMFRKTNHDISYEDLYASGLYGLWQAAQKYEAGHHTKFTTYAWRRVVGQMTDDVRDTFWGRRGKFKTAKMYTMSVVIGRILGTKNLDDARVEIDRQLDNLTTIDPLCVMHRDSIQFALSLLDKRLRLVVILYHLQHISLRAIGNCIGVTEVRVCQIKKRGLASMKKTLEGE